MIRGLYISAAGLFPRDTEQEIAANNLANLNTTGYKKDAVHFKRLLDERLSLDSLHGGESDVANSEETLINFSQGELLPTNVKTDFAIDGDGFFTIQTPQGERYTRDGNFKLNEENQLVTSTGQLVLGESGPIQLLPGDFQVKANGDIYQNGSLVDRFQIVTFPKPLPLKKAGENLFELTVSTIRPEESEKFVLQQGFLEGSNVNAVSEMVRMIDISKAFEAGQKAIRAQDATLDKVINQTARY